MHVAADGQTLEQQSPEVRSAYYTRYGANAAARWATDHNAALGVAQPGFMGANPNQGGGANTGTGLGTPHDSTPTTTTAPPGTLPPAMVKPEPALPGHLPPNYLQLTPQQQAAAQATARGGANPQEGFFDTTGRWVSTATDDEDFNAAEAQAANNAAQIAFYQRQLDEVGIPGAQNAADAQALAEAKFAWDQRHAQEKFLWDQQQAEKKMAWDEQQAREKMGYDLMRMAADLRGPRNAFQQQAVMSGIGAGGYSNAIDAIAGRYKMPSFQAPMALPQAASLQTLVEDIQQPPRPNGGM